MQVMGIAIITGSGKDWEVFAGSGRFSGFGSFKWAAMFAENRGYTIWLDPDV